MDNEELAFLPDDDAQLKTMVRGLTGYDDTTSEFTDTDLDTQINLAKMTLHTEYDLSEWYTHSGVTQALTYLTAILCKCSIENYSTRRWDVGDQSFWSRQASPDESAQLSMWTKYMNKGLDGVDGLTTSVGPALTSNFNF